MYKAVVEDRNSFKTTKDELKLIEPEELQFDIEKLLKKHKGARAFVRPSGTEDILRLYVEAEKDKEVDFIAEKILKIIETKYKDYHSDPEPEAEPEDVDWMKKEVEETKDAFECAGAEMKEDV